jgi:hypothetical protein
MTRRQEVDHTPQAQDTLQRSRRKHHRSQRRLDAREEWGVAFSVHFPGSTRVTRRRADTRTPRDRGNKDRPIARRPERHSLAWLSTILEDAAQARRPCNLPSLHPRRGLSRC